MRNAAHLCPVPACGNIRERWQSVCRSCWRRLPADLRERIGAAKLAKARHLEANAAIEATRWLTEHAPGLAIARVTGEASAAPP